MDACRERVAEAECVASASAASAAAHAAHLEAEYNTPEAIAAGALRMSVAPWMRQTAARSLSPKALRRRRHCITTAAAARPDSWKAQGVSKVRWRLCSHS